jgi:predicted transcriptional regulator
MKEYTNKIEFNTKAILVLNKILKPKAFQVVMQLSLITNVSNSISFNLSKPPKLEELARLCKMDYCNFTKILKHLIELGIVAEDKSYWGKKYYINPNVCINPTFVNSKVGNEIPEWIEKIFDNCKFNQLLEAESELIL